MNVERLLRARRALVGLGADAVRVRDAAERRGARRPRLAALADPSLWALTLMRGGTAARALAGSSLGTSAVLRVLFHIDVWSDDIGPGLRLPHPFNVVIGGGVEIGAGCTLMHNVTVQHGASTRVGDGAVLGTGTTVLAGSQIGARAIVGAASVVRGTVPAGHVAVGAPARVIRAVRAEEMAS